MRIYDSIPMAIDDSTGTMQAIDSLLHLVGDVARTSDAGFRGPYKKDCTDLSRRVSLLLHLLEEIKDFLADHGPFVIGRSSSSFRCSISQLTTALTDALMLLQSAGSFDHDTFPEEPAVEFITQFQSVSCKLDQALASFPYAEYRISEDVKQQVNLVRGQLKRAAKQHGVESRVLNTSDAAVIPVNFLCPISRKLIKDPVIVSTGETYERSNIQRRINGGDTICPITRQRLKNLDLIPNHVLRNLIAQWCTDHKVEQPALRQRVIVGSNRSRTRLIEEEEEEEWEEEDEEEEREKLIDLLRLLDLGFFTFLTLFSAGALIIFFSIFIYTPTLQYFGYM